MSIAEPSPEQITECFKIEQSLGFDAPDADTAGFFLPGATEALYQDLYKTGYTRVILDDAGRVSSYVVVVPPGHSIVERSLANNPAMLLCGDTRVPTPSTRSGSPRSHRSLLHVAPGKPGRCMRPGLCRLCRAAPPSRRRPSRQSATRLRGLSRRHGHAAGGRVLSPPRGEVKHIVNLLWRKQL